METNPPLTPEEYFMKHTAMHVIGLDRLKHEFGVREAS